jgi:hypothetical protein
MNGDVEQMVREGLDRLTEGARPPTGLVNRARRHRSHRRLAAGSVIAGATAAVTVAAVIATGAAAGPGTGAGTRMQNTAYVMRHVASALANENLVMRGYATQTYTMAKSPGQTFSEGTMNTWAYGPRSRFEEVSTSRCGHVLSNGACTYRGGPEAYLASGTALVSGKLTGAYVTYYDRKYSLSPLTAPAVKACSTTARLAMGGPLTEISNWRTFITTMLGCGAATVTGHVRIDGRETTEISGSVTVPLSKGYAKTVHEKEARVRFTLWVNPTTYLPIREFGSTETYGGSGGDTVSSSVTDLQWLPPTAANVAQTLVTIPPGYQQVSSPADQ